MASYKWGMSYECSLSDAKEIIELYGFEYDETDQVYVKEINNWEDLELVPSSGEIDVIFAWTGDGTTEVYFDYLINCGVLLGQMMVELEKKSQKRLESENVDEGDEDG